MSFLGKIAKFAVTGLLGKAIFGGKKKPVETPAAQVPVPTRNMASEQAARADLLAKRRGVIANLVMGARGAEAGGGTGTKLGN